MSKSRTAPHATCSAGSAASRRLPLDWVCASLAAIAASAGPIRAMRSGRPMKHPLPALLAGFALSALAPAHASAQDYPNRPVTLVVPYAAGGGLDVLARMLAQKLTDRLGKPFVVDNRPGAGTVIGANSVAKAAPDGYTIMLGTSSAFAINPTLHKSLPYDPAKDFAIATSSDSAQEHRDYVEQYPMGTAALSLWNVDQEGWAAARRGGRPLRARQAGERSACPGRRTRC